MTLRISSTMRASDSAALTAPTRNGVLIPPLVDHLDLVEIDEASALDELADVPSLARRQPDDAGRDVDSDGRGNLSGAGEGFRSVALEEETHPKNIGVEEDGLFDAVELDRLELLAPQSRLEQPATGFGVASLRPGIARSSADGSDCATEIFAVDFDAHLSRRRSRAAPPKPGRFEQRANVGRLLARPLVEQLVRARTLRRPDRRPADDGGDREENDGHSLSGRQSSPARRDRSRLSGPGIIHGSTSLAVGTDEKKEKETDWTGLRETPRACPPLCTSFSFKTDRGTRPSTPSRRPAPNADAPPRAEWLFSSLLPKGETGEPGRRPPAKPTSAGITPLEEGETIESVLQNVK